MKFLKAIRWLAMGLAVTLGGYWFIFQKLTQDTQVVTFNKNPGGNPIIGGPFELIDQDGKVRKDSDFRGKFMLVYFGYSYCPDICPLGLQNMTEALKILGRDREKIIPIFITVDPNRDTFSNLKQYSTHFDPNFVMLTGDEAKINEAIKNYKVFAQKHSEEESSDYLMDHSTMIYLMSPEGKYIKYFPHSENPKKISKGIIEGIMQFDKM